MSEEFKIGSYSITSQKIYDILKDSKDISDSVLEKLDKNGDKKISEEEYINTDKLEEDTTADSSKKTSSSATGTVTSDEEKYEQQLILLYKRLETAKEERNALLSKMGTSKDFEEYNSYYEEFKSKNENIDSIYKEIYQTMYNKEVAIANAAAAAASSSSSDTTGSTQYSAQDVAGGVTGKTNFSYNFKETLTSSQQSNLNQFKAHWEKNKSRYQYVAAKTGVPAELVAAIHWRESSGNFNRRQADGGALGNFANWEESAIKEMSKKYYGSVDKNNIQTWYNYAEKYNGLGYRNRGLPSAYVWAGTSNYQKGKFVADGVFDPNCVDKQIGVAVMLKAILN